ncbi:hypothetical protein HY382_01965 [Candidatus Curtissbacteria bacterium]|nr:hypothetical protein [Candidatus Curtissbacteria bacterium]
MKHENTNWLVKKQVILALGVIAIIAIYISSSLISDANIAKTAEPIQQLTVEPSVSPQPTEKALKIASFLVVRGSENAKKESKKEYGNESMTDSELIKLVALRYDSDPAKMAEKEALVQKIMAEEGQPDYNYTYEPNSPVIDTGKLGSSVKKQQDAIEELERQQDKFEEEQRSLESDLRRQCRDNGGIPVGSMCR